LPSLLAVSAAGPLPPPLRAPLPPPSPSSPPLSPSLFNRPALHFGLLAPTDARHARQVPPRARPHDARRARRGRAQGRRLRRGPRLRLHPDLAVRRGAVLGTYFDRYASSGVPRHLRHGCVESLRGCGGARECRRCRTCCLLSTLLLTTFAHSRSNDATIFSYRRLLEPLGRCVQLQRLVRPPPALGPVEVVDVGRERHGLQHRLRLGPRLGLARE
jgi:hypothetical protein